MNKINIKSITNSKQAEMQKRDLEEGYSDRMSNKSPVSKRNQSLVSLEDATLYDMNVSPLKTGIVPRILNLKSLLEENNDSLGSLNLNGNKINTKERVVDEDQIGEIHSAEKRHFSIYDEIKVAENSGFNGIKTARYSLKTKKDLNVVTKGGNSKDISAKSSPRVAPLSSCKVKKKDIISSPGKKSSQNIVYLCKD